MIPPQLSLSAYKEAATTTARARGTERALDHILVAADLALVQAEAARVLAAIEAATTPVEVDAATAAWSCPAGTPGEWTTDAVPPELR